MKIRTSWIEPPIPVAGFWQAIDENSYAPGDPVGTGRTEQDAIDDLTDKLVEQQLVESG